MYSKRKPSYMTWVVGAFSSGCCQPSWPSFTGTILGSFPDVIDLLLGLSEKPSLTPAAIFSGTTEVLLVFLLSEKHPPDLALPKCFKSVSTKGSICRRFISSFGSRSFRSRSSLAMCAAMIRLRLDRSTSNPSIFSTETI